MEASFGKQRFASDLPVWFFRLRLVPHEVYPWAVLLSVSYASKWFGKQYRECGTGALPRWVGGADVFVVA